MVGTVTFFCNLEIKRFFLLRNVYLTEVERSEIVYKLQDFSYHFFTVIFQKPSLLL
jgi:hypothetical protein